MKLLISTFFFVFLWGSQLKAQDMGQKIQVEFTEVPLRTILRHLRDQYQLEFSYGNTSKALEEKLSIQAEAMPLGQFLTVLLAKAGLTYKKFGSYIVLRRLEQQKGGGQVEQGVFLAEEQEVLAGQKERSVPDSGIAVPADSIRILYGMRRGWTSIINPSFYREPLRVSLTNPTVAVGPKEYLLTVAPLIAMDFLQLSMDSEYAPQQWIKSGWSYSLGWAGSYAVSHPWTMELEVLYRVRRFAVFYLIQAEQTPLGLPERTELNLSYIELPLGVSREVVHIGQALSLHCAAALYGSWLVAKKEETWLDDGRMFNTTALYGHTLSTFVWGLRGAVQIGWKLSGRMVLRFSTVYRYPHSNLKEGMQQIRLQEFSLRTGMAFLL